MPGLTTPPTTDQSTASFATTTQNGGQQNQNVGSSAYQYTPGQQSLQSQLPGALSSLLGGNVPTQYTQPQALINAFNQNFQNSVAPGIAAQFGAGSPQIGSQQSLGLAQLLGNQFNAGLGQYNQALNQAQSFALTPVGASNAAQGNQQYQGTSQNTSLQSNTQPDSLLSQILQMIGGVTGGGGNSVAPNGALPAALPPPSIPGLVP